MTRGPHARVRQRRCGECGGLISPDPDGNLLPHHPGIDAGTPLGGNALCPGTGKKPLPRLTEPQARHLVELYGDGKKRLYWRTNAAELQTARVLSRLGLVAREGYGWHDGWYLTPAGEAVARQIAREAASS